MERTIQILPQKRKIKTFSGERLLEAFIRHGIFLRSDCGGKGKCKKCRVNIMQDDGGSETIESCRYEINEDVTIQIPESSMASFYIMDKAQLTFPAAFKEQFNNSAEADSYGIAVDLGTTTIAVYLCNMAKGEVISSIAVKNTQSIYGDDVMSRIGAIGSNPKNSHALQQLAVKSIEWGADKLLSSLGGKAVSLSKMVVVGNPTMIHIFAGVDPKSIGVSPYQPAFFDAKHLQPDDLGFTMNGFRIQTLPNVSGFIGGDILAAAIASELENQPDGTLLIDLGTNGELLLKTDSQLYAASCATGPAFEGATLSCGMQAVPGAINSVEIDSSRNLSGFTMVNPSGKKELKPSGICGAGVINAVAQFCDRQIISVDGAFSTDEKEYVLVPEDAHTGQSSIYISQKDIRSVQLGKSALITGIEFLLKKAGLSKPEKIIIAGAFGSHLNKLDLLRLGMIPKMDIDKIEMGGNAAGSGAVMALSDERYIDEAIQMADRIETIDLACNVEFQNVFVENLNFPSS